MNEEGLRFRFPEQYFPVLLPMLKWLLSTSGNQICLQDMKYAATEDFQWFSDNRLIHLVKETGEIYTLKFSPKFLMQNRTLITS